MSEQHLFTVDKKGDLRNVEFGEPDRYKTPKFRLNGSGRLLGLDDRYRLDKSFGSHSKRQVYDASLDWSRRHRIFPLAMGEQHPHEEKVIFSQLVEEEEDEVALQGDYISLGPKRRRLSGGSDDRALSPEADPNEDVDFASRIDLDHRQGATTKDSQDYDGFRDNPTHRRNIELQHATKRDPQDIDTWLSVISLQEDLFRSNIGETGQLTAKEMRIISDMKVSIYETAIDKVTDRGGKERLVLGLVQEGSLVWDSDKQASMWKSLLTKNASLDLHVEYLNFLQRNVMSSSIKLCLEQYVHCFKLVRDMSDSTRYQDEKFSYLVLRITHFLYDTGFVERAVGIWQAVLELNCRNSATYSLDERISRLEHFWDFNAFRIGEIEAQGLDAIAWTRPSPKDDPTPATLDDTQGVFPAWSRIEHVLHEQCPMPTRLLDRTSEDDPYRYVTFSDVKPFACHVVSESNLGFLIQAFLQFANLPPLFDPQFVTTRYWWVDPYCTTHQPMATRTTDKEHDGISDERHVSNCLTDTTVLFGDRNIWSDPQSTSGLTCNVLSAFSHNVVTHLASSPCLTRQTGLFSIFSEYSIALELQHNSAKACKLAKSLLRTHSNDLCLYNAYANVEAHMGNNETSEKVWSAALSLDECNLESVPDSKILLWHTWILSCLHTKEDEKSLRLMSLIPTHKADLSIIQELTSSTIMTPVVRLRTKQYLLSRYQRALQCNDYRSAALLADILAIFAYLTTEKDFNEMEETYQSLLKTASRENFSQHSSILIENLHQNHVRLVDIHTRISPSYRPRDIIQALRHSFLQFPNNTIVWSLYQHHSRKAGLVDRLRDRPHINTCSGGVCYSDKLLHGDECGDRAISYLHSVNTELNRPSYAGSTEHSIRAAFSRAAEKDSPLHFSPALWEAWLKWEIDLATSAASEVHIVAGKQAGKSSQYGISGRYKHVLETFNSAIRACPWAKRLYMLMLGCEDVEEILGFEGAKNVYESMIERGLRIRFDVSEKLDDLF